MAKKEVKDSLAVRKAAQDKRRQDRAFAAAQDRFVVSKDGKMTPLGPRPSIFEA